MTHKTLLSGVSGLVLAAAATAAPAQQAQPAPSATQVQEVVVTATKRERSVEKIPATIAAITGAEIERRGLQNFQQIVDLTPGVNLTTPSQNAERITIRGIAGEANTNPTTGILFGDISFQDDYVPHVTLDPNPFDMQDVEVLKGPQGALFGASALNGAIRYVPKAPDLDAFGGKYYAQYSGVDGGGSGWSVGAAINIPLVKDKLALRVTGFTSGLPGWIDNIQTGVKDSNKGAQNGVRAILEWKPVDQFTAALTYAHQVTRYDDLPDADNRDGVLSASDRFRASPSRAAYDLVSLRMDYDFGPATLVSETGYVEKSFGGWEESSFSVVPGGYPPIINTVTNQHSQSYSQEIRLVSNDSAASPWSWVVGGFVSRQDIWQNGAYEVGNPAVPSAVTAGALDGVFGAGAGSLWQALGQPPVFSTDIEVVVQEIAGFADVTRKLGDGFELSLGGRLYHASSGGSADTTGFAPDVLSYLTTGNPIGAQLLDGKVSDSGFAPTASLAWRPSDKVMVYGAVSKGYRVGGVQPGYNILGAPPPPLFKTDTIWNYEIGLRSRLFDNSLQFDLTGFYERWKNPQVLIFVNGNQGSYIDNVGGVTSEGVETSLKYRLPWLPGLSAQVAATYDDAQTTTNFTDASGGVVPKGSAWPLAPKWQTAETVAYDRTSGAWSWGASITHTYLGHAIYGFEQPDIVGGYNKVDAQVHVGASFLPFKPDLALIVTNLGDVRGIGTSYSGTVLADPSAIWREVTYIQPRTFTVRIAGSF